MTTFDADEAWRALADLAMRAIDKMIDDYGENAELMAASLVFEVRTVDSEGEVLWIGNYESLPGLSPHHVAGLLSESARQIMTP